jgi:glycosyltransferase involved in cell wall biosynthesis
MTNGPLISIIVNCYNGENYLQYALKSVLSQTYKNWELIFWDNQSNDKSEKIFHSFKDDRFKYFHASKHTILYEARNLAIEKSSGQFYTFLDVDDWWVPEKLEIQIAKFSDKEVGLVYGNYKIFNERKQKSYIGTKILKTNNILTNNLLKNYNVGLLTIMVRSKVFDNISFDSKYHIIGDFDFVIRCSLTWKVESVTDLLAYYRWHDNNESRKNDYQHTFEVSDWLSNSYIFNLLNKLDGFRHIESINHFNKMIYFKNNKQYRKALDELYSIKTLKLKIKGVVFLILPAALIRLISKYG